MRQPRVAGFIAILIATILWSTTEVVTRTIVGRITPLQLALIRFLFGGLLLVSFLPVHKRLTEVRITRRHLGHAVWIGLIGVGIANAAFQYSLKYTGASVVATVFGTNPLIVMVVGAVLLGERLTSEKISGVLLGFVGIVVLAFSKESPTFSLFGFGLAMLCGFCFALFTVLIKRYAESQNSFPLTACCVFFGGIYFIPVVWLEADWASLRQALQYWPTLLYLTVGCTCLPYLLYFVGLEKVEATQAASVLFLKPPLATLLAALWLKEPITWNLMAALCFIFTGLYLVIRLHRQRLSHG
ncbi:MAG: DMT family transporter [Candidatus Hydrogenedentes bacterium]|nr:DMT family transporter [Candidatus Hydrogenedentota bacterium]